MSKQEIINVLKQMLEEETDRIRQWCLFVAIKEMEKTVKM